MLPTSDDTNQLYSCKWKMWTFSFDESDTKYSRAVQAKDFGAGSNFRNFRKNCARANN